MKKSLLFLLTIAIPGIILSQGFNAADSVIICIVRTDEGTMLKGKLQSENVEQITVIDLTLGEVTLNKNHIRYFEKTNPGSSFEIKYGINNTIRGKIISIDKEKWKINSSSLGEVEIRSSDIRDFFQINGGAEVKKLHSNKEGREFNEGVNIDPGKYFVGTTPFALPKNHLIHHNTDILLNDLSYGLFKNFTITGGLFFVYIPYANIKYATKITHNVHLSVGAMACGFPVFSSNSAAPLIGAPYAQIALGNSENHFSFGAYYPYIGSFLGSGDGFTDELAFSGAGIKQINKSVALMIEDYFIPFRKRIYNYNYYSQNITYSTSYLNVGAVGVKLFLSKGWFNSGAAVLNLGMCWISNYEIMNNTEFVAFPIVGYAHFFK